ncbi:hypothetical protein ACIBK9_47300 [Nonomuraea sp. NPDC050227]|uniref:hypothetical protein n=1 Tax=Nonomuraea sp. NPDC050227 TaxID=3364360 RepID=UPI0037A5D4AF
MSDFVAPPGANDAIREHLVNSAEIARRTGVTKQAVSLWITRHQSLAELVITWVGSHNPMFWWPEVEAELGRLGLPGAQAGEPRCGATRVHDQRTLICARAEDHDGSHIDRYRRARWADGGPATDLEGRPLLGGTVPTSDPRAFRRRRTTPARLGKTGGAA